MNITKVFSRSREDKGKEKARKGKKRGRAVKVDKNMKGTKRGTSLTLRDYITYIELS